jgi:hypothetical protein
VVGVDGEAVVRLGVSGEAAEHGVGDVDRRPTLLADEVPVGRRGQVIGGRPVADVGVDHDAQALELVEVAVDGRGVHVGQLGLHGCRQLLGAPVLAGREERAEEDPPRRGDPSPVLSHHGQHVFDPGVGAGRVGVRVSAAVGVRAAPSLAHTPTIGPVAPPAAPRNGVVSGHR